MSVRPVINTVYIFLCNNWTLRYSEIEK